MTRTKKAAKIGKNKKYKKLPLDPTPWEELSRNIKKNVKSEIPSQDDTNISLSNSIAINYRQSKHFDKLENRKPSSSFELNDTYDCDNNQNKTSSKNHSIINSDFMLSNRDDKKSLDDKPNTLSTSKKNKLSKVKKLKEKKLKRQNKVSTKLSFPTLGDTSVQTETKKVFKVKFEKRELKEHKDISEFSPVSSEKSVSPVHLEAKKKVSEIDFLPSIEKLDDTPTQSPVKKLSAKERLKRNNAFDKMRFERRKELGIMVLPKNIENRLSRIRKALRKKNLPPEEIKSIMRKERSKAQDDFRKSHSTQICFNCRKSGHLVANCRLNEETYDSSICIKCGSTKHKYNQCEKKINGFPFATCFICKGKGHISRDCPNNEHGIYPKGGKCNLCDSVNHLKKDCPTLRKQKKSSTVSLYTIDNGTSIDDEVMDIEQMAKNIKSEKPKVVTF